MCERYIDLLPLARPPLETWPITRTCALTGNQTHDISICRPVLHPLSHTSQGNCYYYLKWWLSAGCGW